MKRMIVMAALLLGGCAGIPVAQETPAPVALVLIKRVLDANFTHAPTVQYSEPDGDKPFKGDCKQYSAAAHGLLVKAGLPAKSYFVNGGRVGLMHLVTCSGDWCLDFYYRTPVLKVFMPHRFIE